MSRHKSILRVCVLNMSKTLVCLLLSHIASVKNTAKRGKSAVFESEGANHTSIHNMLFHLNI